MTLGSLLVVALFLPLSTGLILCVFVRVSVQSLTVSLHSLRIHTYVCARVCVCVGGYVSGRVGDCTSVGVTV